MTLILTLSFLSIPFLAYLLYRMFRSKPATRPGKISLILFALLLVPLVLISGPLPILHFPLPTWISRVMMALQSLSGFFMVMDAGLYLLGCLLLVGAWWRHEKKTYVRRGLLYAVVTFFLNPFLVIWGIAGSESLFRSAVPIEQRLVSTNSAIRSKATQELLGMPPAAKSDVSHRLVSELESEDPVVRKWAAIALALLGPSAQEAIPTLIQATTDPESQVSEACRVALSEIGPPDTLQLPLLMPFLADANETVRCEAATSIAKMGPGAKDAVPLIVDDLRRGTEAAECSAKALAALAPTQPEVMPALLELLKDPDAGRRRNATWALQFMEPQTPQVLEALFRRLGEDSDASVRRIAAKGLTLRHVPDRGWVDVLIYALRRAQKDGVREAALAELRKARAPWEDVFPALIDALQDSDASVRAAAVQWLGELGPPAREAIPALLGALKDENETVRRGAIEALRKIGVRRAAALPMIAHAQNDSDAQVRCQAAQLLVEMNAADRVSVFLLSQDLRLSGGTDDCAGDALGMTGHFSPDVVPALMKLLGDRDMQVRSKAASVLMQLGARARAAIPALEQARRDHVNGADIALKTIQQSLPTEHKRRRR